MNSVGREPKGPSWQHVGPQRGHPVPVLTATRPEDGESLCTVCWQPVELTPAWSAYYDRVGEELQRVRHSTLIAMGYPPSEAMKLYRRTCSECPHTTESEVSA